jgi:hypothetical protein
LGHYLAERVMLSVPRRGEDGEEEGEGVKDEFKTKRGLGTFRYMLKDRRALFTCRTYLAVYK